jgi:hypothetical protein
MYASIVTIGAALGVAVSSHGLSCVVVPILACTCLPVCTGTRIAARRLRCGGATCLTLARMDHRWDRGASFIRCCLDPIANQTNPPFSRADLQPLSTPSNLVQYSLLKVVLVPMSRRMGDSLHTALAPSPPSSCRAAHRSPSAMRDFLPSAILAAVCAVRIPLRHECYLLEIAREGETTDIVSVATAAARLQRSVVQRCQCMCWAE